MADTPMDVPIEQDKQIDAIALEVSHIKMDSHSVIQNLETDLKKQNDENEKLTSRITNLEKELKQMVIAAQMDSGESKKNNKNDKNQDDLLTKAKELLFEKAKISKQQESRIEALNTQIESLKDVLSITKNMLEIRNVETEHMQTRLDTIDLRLKAEREKQSLWEKKLQISQKMYADLKKEYTCQSTIFKELRKGYEEKINLLAKEVEIYKSE